MSTRYSATFRETIIQKILSPDGPTVVELSKELGISKNALYQWVHRFKKKIGKLTVMSSSENPISPQILIIKN